MRYFLLGLWFLGVLLVSILLGSVFGIVAQGFWAAAVLVMASYIGWKWSDWTNGS